MIKIQLFVDSDEGFIKFKKAIPDGFDETLAIISNEKYQYEFYATEQELLVYKDEKNDRGEFETVDRYSGFEYINGIDCLEDFIAKIFKIIL